MRKLIIVLTLLAFMAPSALVSAREPEQERQIAPKIKCCFPDGQCLETRKENCALKQAIVVTNCDECPGVWGKKK